MAKTTVKDLLDAGVHFGHLTRKWNPNMAPYIYMERNGIHIISLYKTVAKIEEASEEVSLDVVTEEKYSGYISRQKKEIEKAKSNENALIPDQLSYQDIKGLSNESRQKLLDVKPRTIAHAQRIPGITPATISLLLVHLKRTQNWKSANVSKKSV